MQPTFLPWLGYFDLMDQVDHFVYLDSVQFSKQSWQQRNRIRTSAGLSWVSVPVDKRSGGSTIVETRVNASGDFPDRCLRTLGENYRRAPYVDRLDPVLARIEAAEDQQLLPDLLLGLLDDLRDILGISTPTSRSSEMAAVGSRSEYVIELVQEVGGETYISPPGSLDYLIDDVELYERAGLPVVVHEYEHPIYAQLHEPFEPYASIVDLIANVGDEALAVIRSGRRPAESLEARLGTQALGASS